MSGMSRSARYFFSQLLSAVGSGVAMMYQQMAAEEQQEVSHDAAAAHSIKEAKVPLAARRGAASAKGQ